LALPYFSEALEEIELPDFKNLAVLIQN